MSSKETVVYIGRKTPHNTPYMEALQKHYTLELVTSGKGAIETYQPFPPRLLILDAVSLRSPSDRVCRNLKDAFPDTPLIHILAPEMNATQSSADGVLQLPLTPRRLLNQVKRLVNAKTEEIITCGAFRMNIPRRIFYAYGEESQLNPKQASLAEYFLRRPNQVIDRKVLMEDIWKTQYVGDTRTIDVHIRWLRQIMEGKDKHPRVLVTVRGIGYRLEIPASELAKGNKKPT